MNARGPCSYSTLALGPLCLRWRASNRAAGRQARAARTWSWHGELGLLGRSLPVSARAREGVPMSL